MLKKFARIYDRLAAENNLRRLEVSVVVLAIIVLLINLSLITLARLYPETPLLGTLSNLGYLSALYTPFSILLIYEVILLIVEIPKSTSISVGRQYEVVSLILIREVFKDFAKLETLGAVQQADSLDEILRDIVVGLLAFALVAVFYWIRQLKRKAIIVQKEFPPVLLHIKKTITLFLAVGVLIVVTISVINSFALASFSLDFLVRFEVRSFTFQSILTLMIFADVVLLLMSYLFMDSYQIVFRNACYVISIIMVRFSLGIDGDIGGILSLTGILLGVIASAIYLLYEKYSLDPHTG